MPKIVTLTVNPALDLATTVATVEPTKKLRCGPGALDPGGGGVNVARALRRLETEATAIYAVGGALGEAYRQLLDAEGVNGKPVLIKGDTRLDFTVDETDSGEQYRFVLPGPELEEAAWRDCLDALDHALEPDGYAVMSGSLPPGVPEDFYARAAHLAKRAGAQPVLDTSGPPLQAALEEGLFLVKPNARELADLTGERLDNDEAREATVHSLIERVSAKIVALTLGAEGSLVASAEETVRLPAPEVEPKSAVGAGDSFLAGFVMGLAEGRDLVDAARLATAAGAAALLTPATELCRAEDVRRLERQLADAE